MAEYVPTDKERYEDLADNRFHINRLAIASRCENYTPDTSDDVDVSTGASMYAHEQGWDGWSDEITAWNRFVTSLHFANQLVAYFDGKEPEFDDEGNLVKKKTPQVEEGTDL